MIWGYPYFWKQPFEGINMIHWNHLTLALPGFKICAKNIETFSVHLLRCDMAQTIRAPSKKKIDIWYSTTTLDLDHVPPCSTRHWKNKNSSSNNYNNKNNKEKNQKKQVTISYKLMVIIIQTMKIMPLVRKHYHAVVASLASFDYAVGLAWAHLDLWKVLESLTLRAIESLRCRSTTWKIYRNNLITGKKWKYANMEHHGKKITPFPFANVTLKSWGQSRSFGLQIINIWYLCLHNPIYICIQHLTSTCHLLASLLWPARE